MQSDITQARGQRQAEQARQRMVANVVDAIPDRSAVPEVRNAIWRMEKGPRFSPDSATATFNEPAKNRGGIWDVGLRRSVMEQLAPEHATRGDLGSTVGPKLARSAYDLHALFGSAEAARDRAVAVGVLCKRDGGGNPDWVELAAACTGDGWNDSQRQVAGKMGMRTVDTDPGEDAAHALLRTAEERGLSMEAVSSSRGFDEATRGRIQKEMDGGVLGEARPRNLEVEVQEEARSNEGAQQDRWANPRLEAALREREDIPTITKEQADILSKARHVKLDIGMDGRQALKRWEHDRLKPDQMSMRADDPDAPRLAELAHDLQWLFHDDREIQGRRIAVARVERRDSKTGAWTSDYVAACSSRNWARTEHRTVLRELGIRQILDTRPREHAEQSILRDAREKGLLVRSVGVSGRICDDRSADCRGALTKEFTRQDAESQSQLEKADAELRQWKEGQKKPPSRPETGWPQRYTRRDPGREIS